MNNISVTFILCEKMLATSLTLPIELFRAAEDLAKIEGGDTRRQAPKMDIQLASTDGTAVTTHTGIPLSAGRSINDIKTTDLIYLPALWRNPQPILKENRELISWLRQKYENGAIIAGVGTGCCFMAEAGLLNEKPATTHWHYFDEFHRKYPKVDLKRQYFITQSSNLYCTASVNSLGDLTVHFIQKYFSRSIAAKVEEHFFHEIRRAYEKSTSLLEPTDHHPDEEIIQAQIWLQTHQGKYVTIQQLAEQFGMSVRTLNRRFKNATGDTPLNYLQNYRMGTAKDLLKTTNLTISDVMEKTGYHDNSHFTTLFKKTHGTTPSKYRRTVRAKMFSLDTKK